MNYYLDTEFHEYQKGNWLFGKTDTIELISIGIVCEDGREFYEICKEFDVDAAWDNRWLRENVLVPIFFELANRDFHSTHFKDEWMCDGREVTLARFQSGDEWKNDFRWFVLLLNKYGKSRSEIAAGVKRFVYEGAKARTVEEWGKHDPFVFWAYYADYDWVVFCWLFGRMINLPEGFPMYCRDLQQMKDEIREKSWKDVDMSTFGHVGIEDWEKVKGYPKNEDEHNAIADARWNMKLHQFLNKFR